jgi:uncharacterized membrane protein YdbT with pleckstrin-like domain
MVHMGHDRSLALGEESVEILHPHWKTLVGPIAIAIVVVAALLVGEALIPGGKLAVIGRLVIAVIAIALLMWWLVVPLLMWRTTVYEVTNKRMRLRDGVFTRSGRDIPLSRITNVSFRKGVLDRFVGSGTLVVESAGEHGETTLNAIPHVERVSSLLFQLVEDERVGEARPGPDPGDWSGRPSQD